MTFWKRFWFRMRRLPCLLLRAFRYEAGVYQGRVDRDRGSRGCATLTCHFFQFQLLALAVSLLAPGMIKLRCKTVLVFAVGIAALRQSCPMTTDIVVVALPAITGAADIKDNAAFWTSTHSLAYLGFWQGWPCLPKGGTRQRAPIMAGYGLIIGWFP